VHEIAQIFAEAGCAGTFLVERDDGSAAVSELPHEPVVAASVIKVLVAVEAERQFAAGHVDAVQRVRLPVTRRAPGPVGFSLYQDDVEVSARDLVVAMLTVSDNVATDALLDLVGIDACNQTAAALGLTDTVIVSDLTTAVDSIARSAGFATWSDLVEQSAGLSAEQAAALDQAVRNSPALDPRTATRTTPWDMCQLLRSIWSDRATDAPGCGRIRRLMAQQLTRDRLASAFAPPVRVAAKSGGLIGMLRHEVGTIDLPDGRRYFAAVFTRRTDDATDPAQINAAIGRAAAHAITRLEARLT
jgi:beta-lactamase class A